MGSGLAIQQCVNARPDPLLSVEGLHVRYGSVEVLHGVSLHVEEGQIVTLLGANGAGKSTTLMAISGILPAAKGKVHFHGEPIEGLPAEKIVSKGVTQIPEGRRIFPRLTLRENLALGASTRKDTDQVAKDLEWVFKLFPVLKRREHQLAGTLSGGEQQMLALARGLMARPKLLMLDEPSLGLAPKLVAELFETIRQIHAMGLSILLVEQNAFQGLQVAQTAYVLETGKVVLHGPAEKLRQDPAVKKAYLGG